MSQLLTSCFNLVCLSLYGIRVPQHRNQKPGGVQLFETARGI